jgi:hypothetical protein
MSSPTRRLLHSVGGIQQVPELRRAVVRGDPRGPVPQEVLAVLEGHTRRPEPPTSHKGVHGV